MTDAFTALAQALNEYGPALTIVAVLVILNAFFIWRDFRREARQQRQIDDLHRANGEVVLPLLTECKEAIGACKEVIKQNSQIIASWMHNGGR